MACSGADFAYRITAITDGTSNTFFVGEQSRFKDDPDLWLQAWNRGGWFGSNSGGGRTSAISTTTPRLNADLLIPDPGADTTYFDRWFENPGGPWIDDGALGFRSQHPGGGNFLFGDGSVHFIKNAIQVINGLNPQSGLPALGVYRMLATRAGGEIVNGDSF